jgi:hypothetical protein
LPETSRCWPGAGPLQVGTTATSPHVVLRDDGVRQRVKAAEGEPPLGVQVASSGGGQTWSAKSSSDGPSSASAAGKAEATTRTRAARGKLRVRDAHSSFSPRADRLGTGESPSGSKLAFSDAADGVGGPPGEPGPPGSPDTPQQVSTRSSRWTGAARASSRARNPRLSTGSGRWECHSRIRAWLVCARPRARARAFLCANVRGGTPGCSEVLTLV